MNIEIYGALFKNKGAELMLRSICEQIEKKYENGHGVLASGYTQLLDLSHNDILSRRFHRLSGYLSKVPKPIRKKLKIVTNSELDYVLDASGFSYGDQWGLASSTYFIDKIREWKALGCGITLMPQAFGSFDKPGIAEAIKEIHKEVDYMFVRDKVSLKYLTDVVGPSDKIELAPDFTNLISGIVPESFKHSNHIAIIPNCRMLDMTTEGANYLQLLGNCINHLLNIGETPFFLIHEGNDDLEIAKKIDSALKNKIPIYADYNALEIKGVIGNSKFVISSRFHGLVSALSQGVPCLGTGWSHKYQCLFEDYHYPDGLLEEKDWNNMPEVLNHALNNVNYKTTKDKLIQNSVILKKESEKTWDKVFKIIESHKKKKS